MIILCAPITSKEVIQRLAVEQTAWILLEKVVLLGWLSSFEIHRVRIVRRNESIRNDRSADHELVATKDAARHTPAFGTKKIIKVLVTPSTCKDYQGDL